jgi:hypothetical protein
MDLGAIDGSLGPIHQYVQRFSSRMIMFLIIETYVIFKQMLLYKNGIYEKYIMLIWIILFSLANMDISGNLFGWFSVGQSYSIIWFDDIAHIFGTFFFTLIIYAFIQNKTEKRKKVIIEEVFPKGLLAGAIGLGLGTLFGVYEYYSDMYLGTYMVGGVEDAITDNVYDFIGSTLGLFVILGYSSLNKNLQIRLNGK